MTDKTVLEVTQSAREAYLSLSMLPEFDAIDVREGRWDKTTGLQTFARFERDILATRSPDPTPVAWSDEEAFRQMHLLYNYIDDDSIQFTRWQMVVAMSHGMRLAHPPAVPADGLVEAAEMARVILMGVRPGLCMKPGGKVVSAGQALDALEAALAAHRGEA